MGKTRPSLCPCSRQPVLQAGSPGGSDARRSSGSGSGSEPPSDPCAAQLTHPHGPRCSAARGGGSSKQRGEEHSHHTNTHTHHGLQWNLTPCVVNKVIQTALRHSQPLLASADEAGVIILCQHPNLCEPQSGSATRLRARKENKLFEWGGRGGELARRREAWIVGRAMQPA